MKICQILVLKGLILVHGEAGAMKDDLNLTLYGLFSKLTTVNMTKVLMGFGVMVMATSAAVLNGG